MKWIRYFILSAGVILLFAALTRFLAAAGQAQVWGLPDPVLGIPLRYAVMAVGTLELVVALICLFGKRVQLQVGWLVWLGVVFLIFQIGAFITRYHWQGTCVGSLTDPLHLTGGISGFIIGFIPVYLMAGSGTALVCLWFSRRATNLLGEKAKSIKMSCPACGIHIQFENARVGQQINCPKCQQFISLRPLVNLRMSCFFCQGHIEFPAHAIGEKLRCPHCAMDITLYECATT